MAKKDEFKDEPKKDIPITAHGYIVACNYWDPIQPTYHMYTDKDAALKIAKKQLRYIVTREGKTQKEFKQWWQTLEECGHVRIKPIKGGWSGFETLLMISTVVTW